MTCISTTGSFRVSRAIALAAALLVGAGPALAKDACTGSTNNKVLIAQAANNTGNEGSTVSLSIKFPPSNPTIAEGGIYTWSQVSGPAVVLSATSGATTSFVVPHITTGTTAVIVIRADGTGATCAGASPDFNTLSINVANLANATPVALASASAASVNEGAPVTLLSTGSYDPENDPLLFAWTQVGGPAVTLVNANAPTASFIAPAVTTTTTLTFQLRVTENTPAAKFSTSNTSVNVLNVNVPPTAALSCPNELAEGATITLDGSASVDPDGSSLTYSFSQIDGLPLATLPAPPYGSSVSFPAPGLGLGETGHVQFGLTVTDAQGASASASCHVFIDDVTAPVLSGGGDQTLEATSPSGSVAVYSVSAYDNVDGPSVATCVPPSGSDFDLGPTLVTCSQTDSSQNTGSKSFTITVQDTIAPVIAAHANVVAEATSAAGATVTYTAPATSDAHDGAGVASCSPASGTQFAIASTTVTCTASDSQGNAATPTTFKVNVADTIAPAITAPADITVEATGPTTVVALVDATATDAVGPVTITHAPGNPFLVGTTQVTWTATDAYLNWSSTTSHVTVTDTTPPVVDGSDDQVIEATGPSGAFATFSAPMAHDLVDGDFPSSCDRAPGTFAIGTTTVTCSATDAAGNVGASQFTITVRDTTPPVIAVHGGETAEATSPTGAVVAYTAPATSDVVDGPGTATCVPASGSQFPLGNTTVHCDAVDNHGNHAVQTSFTVSVVDTTPPVIAAHDDETAEATSALGAIVSYASPATSDLVDGDGTATCLPASGSQFPLGDTTVNCNAQDAAGNDATSTSFTVSVVDTTPPVIAAHANVSAEATSAAGALVSYTSPATSDAVDGNGTATCFPASGSQFALGTTTVTCNAQDAAGNPAASTNFTVLVIDSTPPVIAAHGNVSAEATGPGGAFVSYASPATSDAVDGAGTATCVPASGSQFGVGNTTIACNATDAAGNHAAPTSFTVAVVDTTAPVIAFHADVTALATSASGAVVTYTLPTASDLVDGSVAVTCTPVSGSTFAIGSNAVNCSATDSHGNTGHSSFNVIVSYAFAGFFKPIDNLPIVNVTKAGQAIPVKFSLGGNMGLAIMAAGYPRSVPMTCSGSVQDVVEETVTAGGSSLSYDALAGQYIYVWKSDKAWAGSCRQLQVKFIDGTTHYANFNFTR